MITVITNENSAKTHKLMIICQMQVPDDLILLLQHLSAIFNYFHIFSFTSQYG